ncbi:hypothetical protein [Jannaschia rubra]|uniref:hypothetical protein n=1 Tax=Jannaschia rubra TaxID=282197 RepID=UPI002492E7E0|nr:hypothetical protein [Jannaschia rubra]
MIGSEFEYPASGIQLKAMFLACGYGVAQGALVPLSFRRADRTTVAYVRGDYSQWQLRDFDCLRDTLGINVVRITSLSSPTACRTIFRSITAGRGRT